MCSNIPTLSNIDLGWDMFKGPVMHLIIPTPQLNTDMMLQLPVNINPYELVFIPIDWSQHEHFKKYY